MSEGFIPQLFAWLFGGGGAVVIIRLLYVAYVKQNPGVEIASAQSDSITMLRDDMKRMHQDYLNARKDLELERDTAKLKLIGVEKELQLARKQIVCLELLLAKEGVDVHEAYKARGLLDEDPD